MAHWYVKDLSKITHISVQTLHHYDRIDLLKPSIRQPNGYRLYSENDLLKLQQIIALKFFGFELSQIKTLLAGDIDMLNHFTAQYQFLEEKGKAMIEAGNALKHIVSACSPDKSIPWETIIQTIEVYRMTQQLEKSWAGKVLNREEMQQYVAFEQDLKDRLSHSEQKMKEQEWNEIIQQVKVNLYDDPESPAGIAIGKAVMDWVNTLYGKKFVNLRNAIWEKGFQSGQVENEYKLTPEIVTWMDKAISAYYSNQVRNIFSQIGKTPNAVLVAQWNLLLTDMYGDEQALKQEMIDTILSDKNTLKSIRDWLLTL